MDRQISTTLWTRSTGRGCGGNVEQRRRIFGGAAPAPSKMAPNQEAGPNLHIVGRPLAGETNAATLSAHENRPYSTVGSNAGVSGRVEPLSMPLGEKP